MHLDFKSLPNKINKESIGSHPLNWGNMKTVKGKSHHIVETVFISPFGTKGQFFSFYPLKKSAIIV